jgi:hypothetical protein
MTILLSQLFSPATLLASALFPARSDLSRPAKVVRARSANALAGLAVTNRLLDTVFGLPPIQEERPYAL